ncbi:MAG: MFS transporter [Ignavibacteriaceae bacterium]|nr:MFS transporter [Ignavibacteriaceae bacterium]
MKNPYSGLKNIPKNIWLLAAATLINRAGTMVLPFIALYANQVLNVSKSDAGIVLAVYGVGAFVSAPFTGKLSDKIGTMRQMRISLFATGSFLFLYSFITDFILFLSLTFIWAILSEAFRPASMAFISDEITSDRRKTAFALQRLAINLGMSIGPVVGGILSTINFHILFYINALSSLAAGVFLTFSHFEKHETVQKETEVAEPVVPRQKVSVFRDRKLIYFLLALIPVEIVFFQHIGALPLFIVSDLGYTTAVFGILTAVNTVLIIFIEVPLNDSMRHWDDKKSLALGALLCGVGFGLMAFTNTIPPIVALIVVWTFGEMIFFPSSGEYVAKIAPEKQRGEYMGYFQMAFSFAFMVGPWLGATVLDLYGPFNLWIGCLAFGLISTVMMLRLKI